jgi:hypothetical protein
MPLSEQSEKTLAALRDDCIDLLDRHIELMRRDESLIAASLRALAESKELLTRIDDILDR